MNDKWTTELPTPKERTRYWFYGWAHGKLGVQYQEDAPELMLLDAIPLSKPQKGCSYIADGNFFYDSEAIGIFKKFEGVDTPSINEFKKMVGV